MNALAYTVGRDVVFGGGLYASTTHSGRRLLAHELTHVVQQRGVSEAWSAEHLTIGPSHSAAELDAHRIGARVGAGGSATGSAGTRHSGSAPHDLPCRPRCSWIHNENSGRRRERELGYRANNVTDTRVGPVIAQGGLMSGGVSRLNNVIIGENLTLRMLARQLLPLWITATPFTPTRRRCPAAPRHHHPRRACAGVTGLQPDLFARTSDDQLALRFAVSIAGRDR